MVYCLKDNIKMKARCIFTKKKPFADGMVEMVIWQLPAASAERPHSLKYRLVYVVNGVRVVGYDNEKGKGDHKHLRELEQPYQFVSVDQLIGDFLADVRSTK
jgi:hypothetical protein